LSAASFEQKDPADKNKPIKKAIAFLHTIAFILTNPISIYF
jgi:hypothetical protein